MYPLNKNASNLSGRLSFASSAVSPLSRSSGDRAEAFLLGSCDSTGKPEPAHKIVLLWTQVAPGYFNIGEELSGCINILEMRVTLKSLLSCTVAQWKHLSVFRLR